MDNFIKILAIIAWPTTVIFFALLFRHELKKVLSRLSKVKYGEAEAFFEEQLSKVETNTSIAKSMLVDNTSELRKKSNRKLERILQFSQTAPLNCVIEAWKEVETSTADLIRAYGYDPDNVQLSKMFRGIIYENDYPWSLYEDYRRLMMLKNKITHTGDFELNEIDVERYARTALDLALFIKKLAGEAANQQKNKA